jgi:hypothetical protein
MPMKATLAKTLPTTATLAWEVAIATTTPTARTVAKPAVNRCRRRRPTSPRTAGAVAKHAAAVPEGPARHLTRPVDPVRVSGTPARQLLGREVKLDIADGPIYRGDRAEQEQEDPQPLWGPHRGKGEEEEGHPFEVLPKCGGGVVERPALGIYHLDQHGRHEGEHPPRQWGKRDAPAGDELTDHDPGHERVEENVPDESEALVARLEPEETVRDAEIQHQRDERVVVALGKEQPGADGGEGDDATDDERGGPRRRDGSRDGQAAGHRSQNHRSEARAVERSRREPYGRRGHDLMQRRLVGRA